MKHWHQCVKYTLPQCSFQFIFLLVSYVYKKGAAKKKEVTEGDQCLAGDRGWHFVILSQAWESPPLVPCINTSFVSCHHRRHCENDVTTRPGMPSAAQSALAAPRPRGCILNPLPRSWVLPERSGPRPCHPQLLMPLSAQEIYCVLVLTASVFYVEDQSRLTFYSPNNR